MKDAHGNEPTESVAGRVQVVGWGLVCRLLSTTMYTMVLAGEFWNGSTEQALGQGFRRLGWGVQDVNRPAVSLGDSMIGRVARRLLDSSAVRRYRRNILQTVDEIRPQFFLTVKGAGLDREVLGAIRSRGCKTIVYYPDFHFDHPLLDRACLADYDYFITTKSFQIDGRQKASLVHHGYSPDVHRRYLEAGESDFQVDVSYCGNHNPYKQRWLQRLVRALPGLELAILGARWQAAVAGTNLERCRILPGISGFGYARFIQLSRINLAFHGGPAGPDGWEDQVSTRTFEIPACGGFMLHIDNPEVRGLYSVGTEIDVFSNAEQLAERISYYLKKPELRAQMGAAATRRCVPAYSYDTRARQIADIICAPLPPPR